MNPQQTGAQNRPDTGQVVRDGGHIPLELSPTGVVPSFLPAAQQPKLLRQLPEQPLPQLWRQHFADHRGYGADGLPFPDARFPVPQIREILQVCGCAVNGQIFRIGGERRETGGQVPLHLHLLFQQGQADVPPLSKGGRSLVKPLTQRNSLVPGQQQLQSAVFQANRDALIQRVQDLTLAGFGFDAELHPVRTVRLPAELPAAGLALTGQPDRLQAVKGRHPHIRRPPCAPAQ